MEILFAGVRANSREIVGFAVKIAVNFKAKKWVSIRFMNRCDGSLGTEHICKQASNGKLLK